MKYELYIYHDQLNRDEVIVTGNTLEELLKNFEPIAKSIKNKYFIRRNETANK